MSHAKPRPFTIDELRAYLLEIFPEIWKRGDLRIEDLAPMAATLRLVHHPRHLRYGGTIAGPAMFALCDVALYVAILGELGRVAHAVTTSAIIGTGIMWSVSEHGTGVRKMSAVAFGGSCALGATTLMTTLFPLGGALF